MACFLRSSAHTIGCVEHPELDALLDTSKFEGILQIMRVPEYRYDLSMEIACINVWFTFPIFKFTEKKLLAESRFW